MSKQNPDEVIQALVELAVLDATDPERQKEIRRMMKESVEDSQYKGLTPVQAARQWVEKNKIKEQLEEEREARLNDRRMHISELKIEKEKYAAVMEATRARIAGSSPKHTAHESPMLSEAIKGYLDTYATKDMDAMERKAKAALSAFLELVGDKNCDLLRQADVTGFFENIQRLPRNWQALRNKGKSLTAIITDNDDQPGLSHSTFSTNYVVPVRQFLEYSHHRLEECGFPSLKTDPKTIAIYYGDKKSDGAGKQRPITTEELRVIFEGERMIKHAISTSTLHKYWLPHIGLFTGARINEICQLDPQTDITVIDGILCFDFTEEGGVGTGVKKSLKTASSVRRVPVHSQLLELGFESYINHLRESGATRLFPDWQPRAGKASKNAERWFQRELETLKIKDITPGKKLVGFHAFRHTFINHAFENDIDPKYKALSGHDDETESDVVKGYRGSLSIKKLKTIMEQFQFDLDFITPVIPS
jgi:integrase